MNPLIQLKQTTSVFLIVFGLACFGLSPSVQAVSPAPDGGYPNFTTAEGENALHDLTSGAGNTALGAYSLFSTTTGSFNTAVGAGALDLNTGDSNTAVGVAALLLNTGTQNTAVGTAALELNDTGSYNTATGAFALLSNTTGVANTALGGETLFSNTAGNANTGTGSGVLRFNSTGTDNTATGSDSLALNTIGNNNTATGVLALASNTTGNNNTAFGYQSLESNTTGSFNIALQGGLNLTTGNFNIDIGSDGIAGEANTIRIGDGCCQGQTFIAGISGTAVSGSAVVVNANGQLGVATSSERFKQDIKPMDKASEVILALRPVVFRYRPDLDPDRAKQFGLVAEDVEKVNPDLIVRDKEGKPYTVRYEAVNAMLLNEFLKVHRRMQEQDKRIEELTAQLKQQAAQIQKVSAQLQLNEPAPQAASNNR